MSPKNDEDDRKPKLSFSTTSRYIDNKASERGNEGETRTGSSAGSEGSQQERTKSVSSIAESARGDISEQILEEAESEGELGLEFLESDEQVQYLGKSSYGIRITTDTFNNRLGDANYSLITDRGVRLVIESRDGAVGNIAIGYDWISEIEYNNGITKDSITVHTNENCTVDVSDLKISFQNEVSDKQTKQPTIESPSIKFRLRASRHSGVPVSDIVSYIESRVDTAESRREQCEERFDQLVNEGVKERYDDITILPPDSFDSVRECEIKYDELESKIEKWKAAESQYSTLSRKNDRLDYADIEVPEPDSFTTVDRCERKYDALETKISNWKSAESQYSTLSRKNDRLDYADIEVPEPDSFTTVDRCERKYDALETKISNWRSAKRQYSKLSRKSNRLDYADIEVPEPDSFNSVSRCERKYDTLETKISNWKSVESQYSKLVKKSDALDATELEIPEPNADQRDISEIENDLNQLNEILSISSNLDNKTENLSINPTQILIEDLKSSGVPKAEELQEWSQLMQKVKEILTFMDDVDLSHPSIDAEHWEESIETALEEQYLNILSPIADQVEKMENGIWELDDLYQMSWQKFETLLGTLYKSFGYETEVTSDTADMGIDVWATNSDERVAIQAKRYQEGNNVGRETLQKLASTLAKGDADRVVVVTTSEFTRTAEEYSESFGSDIKLVDGEELRDQLNNSDIPPIN